MKQVMDIDGGFLKQHHAGVAAAWRLVDGFWVSVSYLIARQLQPEVTSPLDVVAMAMGVIGFYLVGESSGLYRTWRATPLIREIARIWGTWALVVPALLLLAFLTKISGFYSRAVVTTWFALTPLLVTLWRGAARLLIQELRLRGRNTRAVAVVGATRMGEQLARMIFGTPWLGMRLVGFYDDRSAERQHPIPKEFGKVRGDLDAIVHEARTGKIDIVYITLPARAEPRIKAIVDRFSDSTCSVYLVPDFYISSLLSAHWSSVGDIPVVSIFETPFYGVDGWLKRVEDVLLGSLFLAISAIPMLLIALGIKLTSKGPIVFRQRRYGLNGQPIDVLKFRTMNVCEDGPCIEQARAVDPRVTRFGAFLRRTSLDELPQFINVLTGEMSVVGPRPHAVAHNELYRSQIHGYMLRHKVKPGITGWAQVNGWRGQTDSLDKMERRVEHDLAYIRNWALWLDLKIIFMTVFGSAVRRNAF